MSKPRALLFDVGNTRLKWGLLENGQITKTGSMSHEKMHDSGFSALTNRLPRKVDCVFASNVAGQSFATRLSGVMGIHCNCDVHFARSDKEAWGLINGYKQPRRLGVDRWVAMLGARAEFRTALCIVDAGTAVTVDAVDRHGRHIGGLITPGLLLMADALHGNTGEIPPTRIAKSAPAGDLGLFAKTTETAVQNGSLTALCGTIERAVGVMRKNGLRPKVILTGGDAPRILQQLEAKVIHRPHLVLQGLAFMVGQDS